VTADTVYRYWCTGLTNKTLNLILQCNTNINPRMVVWLQAAVRVRALELQRRLNAGPDVTHSDMYGLRRYISKRYVLPLLHRLYWYPLSLSGFPPSHVGSDAAPQAPGRRVDVVGLSVCPSADTGLDVVVRRSPLR